MTDEEAIELLLQPMQGLPPGEGRPVEIDIDFEQLQRLKPQLRDLGFGLDALQ